MFIIVSHGRHVRDNYWETPLPGGMHGTSEDQNNSSQENKTSQNAQMYDAGGVLKILGPVRASFATPQKATLTVAKMFDNLGWGNTATEMTHSDKVMEKVAATPSPSPDTIFHGPSKNGVISPVINREEFYKFQQSK